MSKRNECKIHPQYNGDVDTFDFAMFGLNPRADRFKRVVTPEELKAYQGETLEMRSDDVVYIRKVTDGVILRYYEHKSEDHPHLISVLSTDNVTPNMRRWLTKCNTMIDLHNRYKRPLVRYLSPRD